MNNVIIITEIINYKSQMNAHAPVLLHLSVVSRTSLLESVAGVGGWSRANLASGIWVQFPAILGVGLLLLLAGGPSPILVELAGCIFRPFLAGVCCGWQLIVPSLILVEIPGCSSPPGLDGACCLF